jgi:unsaturated chondroitin disaccharide hydrolase
MRPVAETGEERYKITEASGAETRQTATSDGKGRRAMTTETAPDWVATAKTRAEQKALTLAERLGGAFLHATTNGRYEPTPADWWTSGFWPGLLLLVARRNGDERLINLAREAEEELERMVLDERLYGIHHDVGFQFMPTAVARFKLTGDPSARRRGFLATALLMARFNPSAGFIEAWNGEERRGIVIVDTMMNLALLFWAAEEFGQPRFRNVAEAHAALAMRYVVRPNGSTNHIVRFDQRTGARIEILGGQGYAPDSRWSRGQAWALYGFALAARYTQDPEHLATARRVADNFVAALPSELVPPWDFAAPDAASAPRDSSAGAIAASGLLELARLLPPSDADAYRRAASDLLRALDERCFGDSTECDAILLHATGNLPTGRDVDVSLIYGDFFYLEALGKLAGITETCW